MPQDAGHAFCRCAMSLFYIFGCNINDSHYYYFSLKQILNFVFFKYQISSRAVPGIKQNGEEAGKLKSRLL